MSPTNPILTISFGILVSRGRRHLLRHCSDFSLRLAGPVLQRCNAESHSHSSWDFRELRSPRQVRDLDRPFLRHQWVAPGDSIAFSRRADVLLRLSQLAISLSVPSPTPRSPAFRLSSMRRVRRQPRLRLLVLSPPPTTLPPFPRPSQLLSETWESRSLTAPGV